MKEQVYDWENKNTALELQMEDYKNNTMGELESLKRDAKTTKDSESELSRKYDALKKKYDTDC